LDQWQSELNGAECRIASGLLLGHIVAHGLRGILEIKALLKANEVSWHTGHLQADF
jgi:hypothetical protein